MAGNVGGGDLKSLIKDYARIQTEAYKSQSAKSSEIADLKAKFTSYFDANPDKAGEKTKILSDLGSMESMASAHEADPKHTDNQEWDNTRSDIESLINDMSPDAESKALIQGIPHGGDQLTTTGSGLTGTNFAKLAGNGDASGNGWDGANLNNAASSKDYKGLSIDQLLASNGDVGQQMRARPDLVNILKKVAAETGVPGGLLAATAYQETTFGADMSTTTDASGGKSVGLFQGSQSWADKYNPGGSVSNIEDNARTFARAMASLHEQHGSWGSALREWNSGQVPDQNNLANTGNGSASTISYVTDVLGLRAMGKGY